MKVFKNISLKLYALFLKNRKQITFPFFLFLSFLLFAFISQNKNHDRYICKIPDGEDSLNTNQPQVNYKVNKQYDEQGNLIGYDSTYTYYYSSPGAEGNFIIGNDSLMSMFNNINMPMNMFDNDIFERFFNHNNLNIPNNIFQNDPFFNNGLNIMDQMREQMKRMQQMDSVYRKQQNAIPAPDDKKNDPINMISL